MGSCWLWLLLYGVTSVGAVTRPPSVIVQADQNVYYKAGETVQMPCEAIGIPKPVYTWKRNGIDFNPSGNDDRMVQLPNLGTIVINRPEDKDEGIYQCFADNGLGKSATININLREAKLKNFNIGDSTYYTPQLGLPLTLVCVAPESVPLAEVYWAIKDSNGAGFLPISYDARVSMDHESRLRFVNVIAADRVNGRAYVCMAMNTVMRSSTQGPLNFINPSGNSATLTEVQYMWSSPVDHFGLRGTKFQLKCIFSGNPTPDVHWERTDGQPLSDRAKSASFGQELIIDNIQFADAGDYECWATNTQSTTRVFRTFSIRVESTPYWLEEPKDVELGLGGIADFYCKANSIPQPDIKWYINTVPYNEVTDPRIDKRVTKLSTDHLRFVDVNKEDYMVIQCNATNKHGYIWGDVYLNVLSEAPTIMEPPKAVEVVAEGQSVNLTCRTAGKPDPQITWIRQDRQITGGRYRTLLNGDLSIEKVVLADAGTFTCRAENIYGDTSAEGVLMVRRKTQIEQAPLDLQVTADTVAKFTCSATTDPEEVSRLRIRWLKDQKEITANDQRMTTNNQDNSLTISGTNALDSGTYTCVADNGLDIMQASAILTVKDRPLPPESVKVERCEAVNASVIWTPGIFNYAPVQYYVIQYNTSFAPDQWLFGTKVDSIRTQATVSMSPYANYTFRVIAYNKIGESDPSQPTSGRLGMCTTQPAQPDHHPENVRTIGGQRGKLYIEWTPMPEIQQNGPGFQYILQLKRKGDPDTAFIRETISNWRTYYYTRDTPNEVYREYEIILKAKNAVGEAKQDAKVVRGFTGEYIPDPSTTPLNLQPVLVNSTSVTLGWTFPVRVINQTNTPLQGEFKGFKIQFWQTGNRDQTLREWDVSAADSLKNSQNDQISVTIQDLLPDTDMEARVSVMNNFYVGRPSDITKFHTIPGVPGPVESFGARSIGDTHFNLEWQQPLDRNGIITGFDVSYQSVRGLDLGKMQDREPQINDPNQLSAVLSGLLPNTEYRVYIYARTIMGRGDPYFIDLITTTPGTPEAPRFTISNIGEDYINVTWWVNPYARSGTVVFVEYRKEGATEWLQSTDEVVNMWKNITNLESGTVYDIRVISTNGRTRSESSVEKVRTYGVASAIALIGNIGWFIGMLIAILVIIGLGVLFYLCFKRGFRFKERKSGPTKSAAYSDKAPVARHTGEPRGYSNDYYNDRDQESYLESHDGKQPPSYHSDYDRDYDKKRDSRDYDHDRSYDDDYDHDRQRDSRDYGNDEYRDFDPKRGSRDYDDHDGYDDGFDRRRDSREFDRRMDEHAYEDYERRPSADYDSTHREPDKFDRSGTPVGFDESKKSFPSSSMV